MKRKIFTREFKIRVLELVETSGKSLRQVSLELGISENNLPPYCGHWRTLHKRYKKWANPGIWSD